MTNPFKSLRWRIQIWHGILLFLILLGFGLTIYSMQQTQLLRRDDDAARFRIGALLDNIRRPGPGPGMRPGGPPGRGPQGPRGGPDREMEINSFPSNEDGLDSSEKEPPPRPLRQGHQFRLDPKNEDLFNTEESPWYYAIWFRDGQLIGQSPNAPSDIVPPIFSPSSETRNIDSHFRKEFREHIAFTPRGECILVGRSYKQDDEELKRYGVGIAGLGGGILLLGILGGGMLTRRAIRPLETISQTATQIATGDLSHRIGVEDTDTELGRLAMVLNSTFARLESVFSQQAQFTSDASHELRTPLSVILTQTQVALSRERPASEYRETLQICQRAAQRMQRLIESLLELARFDAGQAPIQTQTFNLESLLLECVDLLQPLALERQVKIHTHLKVKEAIGDPIRLSQVFTNLLTNAVLYNKPKGEVHLRSFVEGSNLVVQIEDTGRGIPPEELPNIFKRLYRVDKSRTSSKAGTGLGLAISKAIVDAHSGRIDVSSELNQGSRFTLYLPL